MPEFDWTPVDDFYREALRAYLAAYLILKARDILVHVLMNSPSSAPAPSEDDKSREV